MKPKRRGTCGSAWTCAVMALTLAGCGSRGELGPVANARTALEIRTALGSSSDAGGVSAAASTGTGWATLRGRFVYDGTPPQMAPYAVTKEQAFCTEDGRAPPQETLLVDSATGGIRNIAVYLRDARRVHESAQATGGSVEFDQKVCVFLTHVLAMTVGQTIEIKNSDNTGHNTKIVGVKNKFNQSVASGTSLAYKPQKEEPIPAPVVCNIHTWMVAYLLPRENGYFAVTTADGSFEIANVPAGEELEIQVWHERGTGAGGGLVLTSPKAKELDWSNKGRFTVTLQADEVKEIQITVPASAFGG